MYQLNFEVAKSFLEKDPIMSNLVQKLPRPDIQPNSMPILEALVHAIIGQQLSTASASAIKKKFFANIPQNMPLTSILMDMSEIDYKNSGISNQKMNYLRSIGEYFTQNITIGDDMHSMKDEEIIGELTKIKGVGEWTVQMLLIFNLLRTNVFPINDLAILQSGVKLLSLEDLTLKEQKNQLMAYAENWVPHKTVASLYLWSWRDKKYVI